jgi:hypothetical protein
MILSRPVIHQQFRQLTWHLLACFALIIVLPVEEAFMNLKDGSGFYSEYFWRFSIMFSPFLAGIIGCANVQGDLNEKRYNFWRSKPAGARSFIALKYFLGLTAALLIMLSPVIFSFVTCQLTFGSSPGHLPISDGLEPLASILFGVMTYSLCFGCNVVIRSSARAWLTAMLISCFVLILPFVLPLGYKDFVSDVILYMPVLYIVHILAVSAAAFVFSLFAVQHDWHLKINFKRLLWGGGLLLFTLLMLFGSQVANIKVLQEKQIEHGSRFSNISNIGEEILLDGTFYVDVENNNISTRNLYNSDKKLVFSKDVHADRYKGYRTARLPRGGGRWGGPFKIINDQMYAFEIHACYRDEKGDYPIWGFSKRFYEKLYIRSFKFDTYFRPAGFIDISDYIKKGKSGRPFITMRLVDNKIVLLINNNSLIVVDVSDPMQLKLIDEKPYTVTGSIRGWLQVGGQVAGSKDITIPIIPTDKISIEERIKFSIDHYFLPSYRILHPDIFRHSMVDVNDGKISFVVVSSGEISRFDVTGWDDEKIYCKFSAKRPFTMLERITDRYNIHGYQFVHDGNLYMCGPHSLLVFDIRSKGRIRKLGHFVRSRFYYISDIAVLEDGNILMIMRYRPKSKERDDEKQYLYLLKSP